MKKYASVAALLVLASSARADLIVVDGGGSGDYLTIQEAIDAASDGDTISVEPGAYSNFIVSAKGLVISANTGLVTITGSVTVSDLGVAQTTVLQGLDVLGLFAGTPLDHGHGVLISNCLGRARFEDCSFGGINGATVEVVFVGCTLAAGNGTDVAGLAVDAPSGSCVLHQCSLSGDDGFASTDGGSGARIFGSQFVAHDSSFVGGATGWQTSSCGIVGAGGDGLVVGSGTEAYRAQCSFTAGPGSGACYSCQICTCCYYVTGGSSVVGFVANGPAPTVSFDAPERQISELGSVTITSSREPNDSVWAILSDEPQYLFDAVRSSAYLVNFASTSNWHFLGTTDATGSLTAQLPLSIPVVDFVSKPYYVQTIHRASMSALEFFGAARTVTVIAETTGIEFCNGDGGDQMGCSDCPCSNNSPAGTIGGCLNSVATSARLLASGFESVSADSLGFQVEDARPIASALLVSAANALPLMGPCSPGSGIAPFQLDGLRCIGGDLKRHGIRGTDQNGTNQTFWGAPSGFPIGGLIAVGGFVVGQTRRFQIFYREDAAVHCGTRLNTSNAIELTFVP